MAPSRGSGFDGQLFFVYDREAVTKEGDPPEDAIIYFYPPSASIESRVSICGQLVGVSNFLTTVLDFAPVLIKLKTEKVALLQSGKYTLAFGGSSSEPESLLLRQLNALFSVFAFYHGSFDNVQKFSKDHISFLSNMTIIWDCYLPFIRYYGDTLPAVFDPLPFLKTPKTSSGSFLKASHILQACQRRRHVLGGCILYKKSVLCTQLEPCITRRLLLFKPNQSHHPAKQVNTEINLPFGVRILHSFLTTYEYERLIKELSRSPYHQSPSSHPTGSSASAEDEQGKELNRAVGERFNGLLHKSVRKKIESESQGESGARENRSKNKSNKIVKPRTRDRSVRERNVSSLDKADLSSTLKHEFSQKKLRGKEMKNDLIDGNRLRMDLSSKHHEHSETSDSALKELGLDQDKPSSAKIVKELTNGKENADQKAEKNKVSGKIGTTSLTNYQESVSLKDGTSYPACSTQVVRCNSISSDEEELTMDEVDVKELKIVSYAEKESRFPCDKAGVVFSGRSSSESQETVKEVCKEFVYDLVEQVVKKSDTRSTRGTLSNGISVHTTSDLPFSSFSNLYHERPSSQTNCQPDILNGCRKQPISLGLDMEESINGHVSESNCGTSQGQNNGILRIGALENGYSNGEDLEQASDNSPVAAADASSQSELGCSTTELAEQNSYREKSESIFTNESEDKRTYSSLCENLADAVTYSFSSISDTDTNDPASQIRKECTIDCSSEVPDDDASSKGCGSPGSEYHDSLEDFVTDGGKSDEKFLEESSSELLRDYKTLNKNDFTVSKYSPKNLNLPKNKNSEKTFFKDLVDGSKDSVETPSSCETKTNGIKHGESNPESSDSEANGCHKDSRTSSGLSEYDDTTSTDMSQGCPKDRKDTLGDSGLYLFHEESHDVSHSQTEVESNPSVPQNHHGDDEDAEEQVEQTKEDNGDDDKEEVDRDEEMDDNAFEDVDGLVHFNLYVQAHSNTVLILLAEDQLHHDNETIKALWKTSLNELGELEVRLNQCQEKLDQSLKHEDYSYLVYDGLSNTTKGNLEEPVLQADHMFCDTAKTVHEQFNNCASLRSVTLRNSSSAVHCQRSLGQEVYFHKKGSFKSFLSSLSPRDPAFTLEKRACKLLHKDHGINVF